MPNRTIDPAFFHLVSDRADGQMVGWTASRESPLFHQRRKMHRLFDHMPLADGFVTGGCVGGDHFIGMLLHDMFPNKRHVVVVPADRSRVHDWWSGRSGIEVIEMPPGTSYRDRNVRLVDESRFLFGIPAHAEIDRRSARSGSWQTVRLARRAHLISPLTLTLEDM